MLTGQSHVFLFLFASLVSLAASAALTSQLYLDPTALSQSYHNSNATLNLNQNEVCKKKGDEEWKCRSLEECRHVRGEPVEVCGFEEKNPIICCRPARRTRETPNKANIHCKMYLEMCDPTYADPQVWSKMKYYYRPFVAGGKLSEPRAHPHMALLGYGESKDWLCGGSLISDRFILTAAHCTHQSSMGWPKVARLGDLDYQTKADQAKPQEYRIVEVIPHPEYNSSELYHDIALLKLERRVEFSPYVRPACLYTGLHVPHAKATATGWGRTGAAEDLSSGLREVDLSLINGKKCATLFKNFSTPQLPRGIEPGSMICAGEAEGVKDTCAGDSGGPLVIEQSSKCLKMQVGITSFGRQCGLPNSPGVYTRVAFYLSWIEKVVWPDFF